MPLSRATFLTALPLAATVTAAYARPAATPLRIGATANDSFAEAYYAHDEGFFTKAGVPVEITTFNNGAAVSTAVASGALDIGISSVITLANAVLHGVPFVYIAGGGLYNAAAPTIVLCVAKDAPIKNASEFVGQTIAVSGIKDITHLATVAYLTKSGVDASAVKIIEMPFSQMAAALKRGTVSGAIISEPSLSAGVDEVRVFAKPFEVIGKRFMIGGWFATTDWVKKNPAAAHRFATVIYETARWANANRERSAPILQRYSKISSAAIARMTRVSYAENLTPDAIDATLELAARERFTERAVRGSEMIAKT